MWGEKKFIFIIVLSGLLVMPVFSLKAQEPPHITITKTLETTGEICPGQIIDISINLYGDGTAGYIRDPLDAVAVIDRSGSMSWGGTCGWNLTVEPPYGPLGMYPYTGTFYHPFADVIWAAWKFYKYLIDVPPSVGYADYGGLVFYGSNPPGSNPVLTPTPIQRVMDDPNHPAHKTFWWFNHLGVEPIGGGTGIGPALERTRDLIEAMPTHPAPTVGPGTPTPPTPYYDVTGERYVILLTDGRPNHYWTPKPGETPGWNYNAYDHAREMSKRMSLNAPWEDYNHVSSTTIYTIGIGATVDSGLMWQIADPFNEAYMYPTPTPSQANHGKYHWAETEDDLIDVFQEIASAITQDRAGKDILVDEVFAGSSGTCPGGTTLYTDIVPGSWNIPPTIIPGDPPHYTWFFDELLVDHEITLTFQIMVDSSAPTSTHTLLECPDSEITYITYHDDTVQTPIPDPGLDIGVCGSPNPTPSSTPTFTPIPTSTPTCVPEYIFEEDFETGDFSNWESSGPSWGVQNLDGASYAFAGSHCAYFAGSEDTYGYNEANLTKILNFASPLRQTAVLDFYVKLRNFLSPEKRRAKGDRDEEDTFIVAVSGGGDMISRYFTFEDQEIHGEDNWFHVTMNLDQFTGADTVRIQFISEFPLTVQSPAPDDPDEPMVFLDEVKIYDYCYGSTATPTVTPTLPQRLPTTTATGLIIMLAFVSIILIIPVFRR